MLPANFFAAGKTIQVTVEGFYALANGGGANTLTVVLNAGTPVTIGTTAKQSLTGAGQSSTGRFQFNLTITARSATTIMVSGDYTAVDASGVLQTTIITNTTVATIVAGTSYTLDLRSTSDTIATGTYALTSKTGTVKIIN